LTHLCIPIDPTWSLDGTRLIGEDCGVGLNDDLFDPIALFPNPAKDVIQIQLEEDILSLQLFDFTGKQINAVLIGKKTGCKITC
jgi:hypothetical protein